MNTEEDLQFPCTIPTSSLPRRRSSNPNEVKAEIKDNFDDKHEFIFWSI